MKRGLLIKLLADIFVEAEKFQAEGASCEVGARPTSLRQFEMERRGALDLLCAIGRLGMARNFVG